MKAVMISIQPKWVEKILSGKKTVEVRKTAPKLKPPFKCYIYCTKEKPGKKHHYEAFGINGKPVQCGGYVVAEFICDEIIPIRVYNNGTIQSWNCNNLMKSCVPYDDIVRYIGNNRTGRGWHISKLKIYDKPMDHREFFHPCVKQEYPYCFDCEHGLQEGEERPFEGMRYCDVSCGNWLKRPPQSWCYVEELQ